MTASAGGIDGLSLVGLSHRTAPFEALEQLALSPGEVDEFYERMSRARVDAMVLSTCNRTEAYALGAPPAELVELLTQVLREIVGPERFPKTDFLYRVHGEASIKHLFRVACGLDSMLLGETQILGQLKDAYELGVQRLPPGACFDRVMQAAFRIGARSRTQTEIGKGAVSVASAAVHLATRVYHDMSQCTVVVVGAGDTGRLLAQHFAAHQPHRLLVLNRTHSRAEQLAREVGGEAHALETLAEHIAHAHVVASAVRSSDPVITPDVLARAGRDNGRALALLDLGLPRNVAVEVNELTNVFVHDLTSLTQMVDGNLARRKRSVPQVEELIGAELQRLIDWQSAMHAGPLISALREAVENARLLEVERATRGLSQAEREAVERATRAVVNKLLHGPMTSIKEAARQAEAGQERIKVIQDVFRHLEPRRGGGGDGEPN